ncbi:uncharacterized protein [Chelonus insularis]|uniref:uncharacterized protein n=1 Tax=Chelonus insularis TaxID=460826 RepID=UPI00158E4A19|nr:uncharacterized protein LOC118064554 [Chelonus insularis]
MALLVKFKKQRAQIKKQVTRIETYFANHPQATAIDAQIRLQKLEDCFQSFNTIQIEIEAILASQIQSDGNESDLNDECEGERELFENRYFTIAAKAQSIIAAASQTQDVRRANGDHGNNYGRDRPALRAKLPEMKLVEFDGDYKTWMIFKNHFETSIHNEVELEPIQKHRYLVGALKGEARAVVERFEISTPENYEHAWKLLKDTYDNQVMLIENHVDALLKMPSISKEDKAGSLRKLIWHIQTHMASLKTLKQPVESWDTLIIHMAKKGLDFIEQRDWQNYINGRGPENMPKLDEFIKFLNERCQTLRVLNQNKTAASSTKPSQHKDHKHERKVTLSSTTQVCKFCNGTHPFFKCEALLAFSPDERKREVIKRKLCINCLGKGHIGQDCRSSTCKHCGDKHNSLLHKEFKQAADNQSNTSLVKTADSSTPTSASTSMAVYCNQKPQTRVILSTAKIYMKDVHGNLVIGRALLDSASQSNIITEELARKLKLSFKKEDRLISGINESRSSAKKNMSIQIKAMYSDFTADIECLVLPSITEDIPQTEVDSSKVIIPKNVALADPEFDKPGKIDLLIGAGLYWKIIIGFPRNRIKGQPALQNTHLGWIIGGDLIENQASPSSTCLTVTNDQLSQQIEKFWKLEHMPEIQYYTKEEKYCEKYFKQTTQRTETGRFIVRLPLRSEVMLGNSRDRAQKRLESMERRFFKDPELKLGYSAFMEEYKQCGHMSLVEDIKNFEDQEIYFIPHQAVVRPESVTTKLRVVFDASSKTTLGTSLNDKLIPGPNLQQDIFKILIKFRTYEYALTADISKMFRQILIDPRDRSYQLILWRTDKNRIPKVYQLNTVTYGTACAPYHAMRCLRELANIYNNEFPLAAKVVEENFYMDDVLTGSRTIDNAIQLQRQLASLLQKGQFLLRKWRSNESQILKTIKQQNVSDELLTIDGEESLKTLGLLWNSAKDIFQYKTNLPKGSVTTKREVLSKISQIFDPLGIVAPILINGKIFMQQLWSQNMSWDQPLSSEQLSVWEDYHLSLSHLGDIKVPRNIHPTNPEEKFDIFGFGDASEKAFGACLYAVSVNKQGNLQSYLLCAKAKVAPLKVISLPRLELEAALLLSQLYNEVKSSCEDKIKKVSFWSDSTIVLGWIKIEPYKLKTFVANRVTKIQDYTESIAWKHVPTESNPEDLLSRGTSVEDLKNSSLWWYGPEWLRERKQQPNRSEDAESDLPELKTSVITLMSTFSSAIIKKYSSYSKLCRIVAYCHRFCQALLRQRLSGPLKAEELEKAERTIMRWVQQEKFEPELNCLIHGRELPKKSKLRSLNVFLDENKIIRVGGRLQHALIPDDQKHQIILPAKHHVTTIIFREEHQRLQHFPSEQLLYNIRQKFWLVSGRRETQKIVRHCLKCFRFKPQIPEVRMGDLPQERVRGYARTFSSTGVDYAGPFSVRESRRRGKIPITKGYVAVFTCFKTKAVHLEMVSELTTEAFLAALDRFTARRGLCRKMHSDNGTNFVGASRHLSEVFEFLKKTEPEITEALRNRKIEWKFNPPRSPHFGGLWEAAVKLVKRHFYTVTQGRFLTFEEYCIVLANIEAVLNSRPLTPLSSDPNDLEVLTPSHFLIGDVLVQPIRHDFNNTPDGRLSRWQYLQKLQQVLWTRWQREYLQELQKRGKWHTSNPKVDKNDMVLLIEDNTSPLHWPLGRVVEIHPGKDGEVRVVTVRTHTGLYKRAVCKICPLPLSEQDED